MTVSIVGAADLFAPRVQHSRPRAALRAFGDHAMRLPSSPVSVSLAHDWFMTNLPEIKSRTNAVFARLSPERREDAIAEVMANVYQASESAARRGVLARITPFYCVTFAAKHYRKGRRIAGYSSTDATSEATRVKGRAHVVSIESADENDTRLSVAETLADKHIDQRPLEQVRVNLDYQTIFRREKVSKKAREVFRLMSATRGYGANAEIAAQLGVTPGRISQMKTELATALEKYGYAPTAIGN